MKFQKKIKYSIFKNLNVSYLIKIIKMNKIMCLEEQQGKNIKIKRRNKRI